MARSTKLFPMLSVADLSRSLALYKDVLGGVETYRFPEAGEPAFLVLSFGSSELGLGKLDPTGNALHGQALRPATGHRVELCVYVDDVDAAAREARASGFSIVLEPTDQPWGERVAYVRDPDENLVMLTK
jgi:lactoylglutathione lyase